MSFDYASLPETIPNTSGTSKFQMSKHGGNDCVVIVFMQVY